MVAARKGTPDVATMDEVHKCGFKAFMSYEMAPLKEVDTDLSQKDRAL